jgi:hypothetical protein
VSALAAPAVERATQWRAFLAVLHRDLYVTWRELPAFLAQVILQPLFLLFVFGKVLGSLGYTQHGYADLLFPGLLALTAVITAMQTLAFPLVAEFGWTKEIEDRLLAPMPTSFVAAEKVVFAVLRALVATLIMLPVGVLILGSIPWRWSGRPPPRRARRGRLRAAARHARPAAADQPPLLARLHPAPVHRVQPVPLAVAVEAALVPGDHGGEPDDVRERVAARRPRTRGAARRAVDLPRRARLLGLRADRGRRARLLPARDRLSRSPARCGL